MEFDMSEHRNMDDVDEIQLSGFSSNSDEDEHEVKREPPISSKGPRSGTLSTIAEESHVASSPRSVSRVSSGNSTMLPLNDLQSTRSSKTLTYSRHQELRAAIEEQRDSSVRSSASHSSSSATNQLTEAPSRPTNVIHQNQSRCSQASNGTNRSKTLNRTEIRNRFEALKPVERLDYTTIMSSLNLRSIMINKENSTSLVSTVQGPRALLASKTLNRDSQPLQERGNKSKGHVVLSERSINGQLRITGGANQTPNRCSHRTSFKPAISTSCSSSSSRSSRPSVSIVELHTADINDNLSVGPISAERIPIQPFQLNLSVLAFGFVEPNKRHCLQLTVRNSSDQSVCFEPSILSENNQQGIFQLSNLSSFSVDSQSSLQLPVYFTPPTKGSFNGQLRLTTIGLDSSVQRIGMFGFGGRAQLSFCQYVSQRMEPIEFGADSVGICWTDRTQTGLRVVLRNSSERSAFAFLCFSDGIKDLVTTNQAAILPNRVVILPGSSQVVDLKFPRGMSALPHYSRSSSRISIVSGQSARTISNEELVRLHVYWGEERQRQRVKMFFERSGKQHKMFNGVDFTSVEFQGENGDMSAKLTGNYDIQAFAQNLRRTPIQFYDNHIRPSSNCEFRPFSAMSEHNETFAHTLNTFREQPRFNPTDDNETMIRGSVLSGPYCYY